MTNLSKFGKGDLRITCATDKMRNAEIFLSKVLLADLSCRELSEIHVVYTSVDKPTRILAEARYVPKEAPVNVDTREPEVGIASSVVDT